MKKIIASGFALIMGFAIAASAASSLKIAGEYTSDFGPMTITSEKGSGSYAGDEPGTFTGTRNGDDLKISWKGKDGSTGKAFL